MERMEEGNRIREKLKEVEKEKEKEGEKKKKEEEEKGKREEEVKKVVEGGEELEDVLEEVCEYLKKEHNLGGVYVSTVTSQYRDTLDIT